MITPARDPHVRRFLVICSLLAGSACESSSRETAATGAEARANEPAALERARGMTKTFAAELQATLLAAIEAGGPVHAIGVCKHDAPRITAAQASEGWSLSRTALRVRNPANAASDWQRAVLERWQAQLDAGEVTDAATLEWSDTNAGEFRYMRGIALGGVCLTCHGTSEQLGEGVAAALAEHYPADQATAFAVGQLRGAIVVRGPRVATDPL